MRILFLTQFFWPEQRTAPTNIAAMAADLKHKGHDVMVITGFPNHPLGKIYEGYKLRMWEWDMYEDVPILRLPLYPDHSTSMGKRILNYGSFALSSSIFGAFLGRKFKPDVIFTYFAPVTIGGPAAWISRLYNAPLLYWITDLWPENMKATNPNIGKHTYQAICQLENWGYKQATEICVDSPGYKSNLLEKGVPEDKIHVVAEWADEALFFPQEPEKYLAEEYELNGKFNVVYGGNLGTVQGLETVLDAAKLLYDLEDLQIVLIGDGNELENLQSKVTDEDIPNVKFIERQPMEKIHKFFAHADVLLVHLIRRPIFELQLPSKILAYLACGRPILCAMKGSSEKVVLDAQAGVSCQSEDPEAMAKQIRHLYNLPDEERSQMGRLGREAHLSNYTRKVQVEHIERIMLALTA